MNHPANNVAACTATPHSIAQKAGRVKVWSLGVRAHRKVFHKMRAGKTF
jgi:hypothetical protein